MINMSTNQIVEVLEIEQQKSLIELDFLNSVLLIGVLVLCLIVGVGIKLIFVTYCFIHTSGRRPVNILIGLDQVNHSCHEFSNYLIS